MVAIDEDLKKILDTICFNVLNGWDFVIIISGDNLTRVGKSTLAQQIGKYCSEYLGTPFDIKNICFGGEMLIKRAMELPKRSVLIDDESRDDISAKKQMETFNKTFMTFLSECGMLNDIIILIGTDFFDFSKGVAVGRSELLINVIRGISEPKKDKFGNPVVELLRGGYDIYDRAGKKKLYFMGKKTQDYNINYRLNKNHLCHFSNVWYIDRDLYEKEKIAFLKRERVKMNRYDVRYSNMARKFMIHLRKSGYNLDKIGEIVGVSKQAISQFIAGGDLNVEE